MSKVGAVASGPRAALRSHVPVSGSLSQLTTHRMPLVLEDDRCVYHSGAASHSPTCCVHAPVSLCGHSRKSIAVCDLSFMTAASMKMQQSTPMQRGKPLKKPASVICVRGARGIQCSWKPPFVPLRQCGQPDAGPRTQLTASPPTLSQSCIFSSGFNWRSIRHMINTDPRS